MEESALFSWVLVRKHQAEGPEDAHHLALGVQWSAGCSPTPSAQSPGAHGHAHTGLPAAPSAAVTAPDVTHLLTSPASTARVRSGAEKLCGEQFWSDARQGKFGGPVCAWRVRLPLGSIL